MAIKRMSEIGWMIGDSHLAFHTWESFELIVNYAMPGQTADNLRQTMVYDVQSSVVVCIGINDLLQDKEMEVIIYSFERLLEEFSVMRQVVWCAIPPTRDEFTFLNDRIIVLNQWLKLQKGINFFDTYALLINKDNFLATKFSEDGLYLNQKGYQIWEEALQRFFKQLNNKTTV